MDEAARSQLRWCTRKKERRKKGRFFQDVDTHIVNHPKADKVIGNSSFLARVSLWQLSFFVLFMAYLVTAYWLNHIWPSVFTLWWNISYSLQTRNSSEHLEPCMYLVNHLLRISITYFSLSLSLSLSLQLKTDMFTVPWSLFIRHSSLLNHLTGLPSPVQGSPPLSFQKVPHLPWPSAFKPLADFFPIPP